MLSTLTWRFVAAVALVMTGAAFAACRSEPGTAQPSGHEISATTGGEIDPSKFVLPVDNPFFPLEPGTTYRYEGIKEGKRAVDVFAVTRHTKMILGVENTVVLDRLYVEGRLEEIAHDWYT